MILSANTTKYSVPHNVNPIHKGSKSVVNESYIDYRSCSPYEEPMRTRKTLPSQTRDTILTMQNKL